VIATLFPSQGAWKEDDYLSFSAERPLVELVHGAIEVLPMPTDRHQRVLDALFVLLLTWARAQGDRVRTSGLRVRLAPDLFRQPDIVYLTARRRDLWGEDFWRGADLVVEVVSPSPADRVRDLVTKRRQYAEAGIAEYWIVEPESEAVTVLGLAGAEYVERGVYRRGELAASVVLAGFVAPVSDLLDAD
jgi:Uma2 family endonuclease